MVNQSANTLMVVMKKPIPADHTTTINKTLSDDCLSEQQQQQSHVNVNADSTDDCKFM